MARAAACYTVDCFVQPTANTKHNVPTKKTISANTGKRLNFFRLRRIQESA